MYVRTCSHTNMCACVLFALIPYYLAITVMFSKSMYNVDENAGPAQPTVILSNPSSTNIIVQVTTTAGSATGEYCSILINIMV